MATRISALVAFLALSLSVSTAHADALREARAFIGAQVELIKKQDVDGLKKTFTSRVADVITADAVKRASDQLKNYKLADLVASVEAKPDAVKIKMKNGRSLTTLVKDGKAWKADTVWFR